MSKKNKKSLWKEFTEFAIKGNAMALAVGTIIGTAFGTITKSLTNDLIMPVVNIFLGGTDFSDIKIVLLTYGNFLAAVINFFILALVVFFIVKGINKLSELGKKKEEEAPAAPPAPPAPPAPSAEETLLTEIRDLLKEKN